MRCRRGSHFVQLDYVVHADCDVLRLRCRLRVSSVLGVRSAVSGRCYLGTNSSVEVLVFDFGLNVHPCGERRPATLRTVHGCAVVHRDVRRDLRCDMRNLPSEARTHRWTMRDTRNRRAHRNTHPAGTGRRPPWAMCTSDLRTPGFREYIPRACTRHCPCRHMETDSLLFQAACLRFC